MTDKQLDRILKMIRMVLDSCKDLEDAKQKVDALLDDRKPNRERPGRHLNIRPRRTCGVLQMILTIKRR